MRLVAVLVMAALVATPLHGQALREVTDVWPELDAARFDGRRIGVALANGSRLFGLVVETRSDRFTLDEQKKGFLPIKHDEIRALLDPTTGVEIATVRQIVPTQQLSLHAKFVIGVYVVVGLLGLSRLLR